GEAAQPQPRPQPPPRPPFLRALGEAIAERTAGRFGWRRPAETPEILVVYLGNYEILAALPSENHTP
ncbi:MAG: hypothetical protein ACO3YQ_06085, partial [Flavobacteriales bacterium]